MLFSKIKFSTGARRSGQIATSRIAMGKILMLLIAQVMTLPMVVVARAAQVTVKMDGKNIFVPEVKLTKKINLVTTFLHIGSWAVNPTKNAQESLCEIDMENNGILIQSSEKLLEHSKAIVLAQNNANTFLDRVSWDEQQATHIAFKAMSGRRQPAVVEVYADSDAALFHNGKLAGIVTAGNVLASGGRGYLPVMLEAGQNIINIKQSSIRGKPQIQVTIFLDHSRDLTAAWQSQGGLLTKLIYRSRSHADIPTFGWSRHLGNFSVSLEIRDVFTNSVITRNDSVRRGRIFNNEEASLARGIYEAVYQAGNERASEFFVVGNPRELFGELRDKLLEYNTDSQAKLDIDAQLRRARILLAEGNYDISNREWQKKAVYTLGCLASFKRMLEEGASSITKDQPGLHIRSFASKADNSRQFYRLFVPSNCHPGIPMPLLVMVAARIVEKDRPFIEGPIIENHQEALLWSQYAEKHGFAVLWPGYKNAPEGYTYESMHIDEAIQTVEKDYNIDKHRISVFGTCGAGYNAGRLVSEYNNRFAAIVYDRAVFERSLSKIESSPSLMAWYNTINPSRHVIENKNLKIFVMHDSTKGPGHGEMELTTQFFNRAGETRDDIVSYLSKQSMGAARMEMTFSWLASCRNENPNNERSHFLAKAGYTGPISEAFATPVIVVEGTHGREFELKNIQNIGESISADYKRYFHGAECAVKKDHEVNQQDIETHTLVLIGNPRNNSVWAKLHPDIPLEVTPSRVLYNDRVLTNIHAFEIIERHPYAADKYILMIGAGDLRHLRGIPTANLFNAWYDGVIFASPRKIISKLSAPHDETNQFAMPHAGAVIKME
jgi:hypothetical protein